MYDDNNSNIDNNQTQGYYYQQPQAPLPPVIHSHGKKHNNAAGKVITVAVCAALCCGSLGIGLGLGSGMYGRFFSEGNTASRVASESNAANEAGDTQEKTFTFKTDANEDVTVAVDNGAGEDEIAKFSMKSTALVSDDADVVDVIKAVSNSVVSINVKGLQADYFNRVYDTESAGSGIIFSEDESNIYIATNHHVISNANQVSISIDDTTSVVASPMGSDAQSDLAVIKVAKADLITANVTDYVVASFGDAGTMDVGETVIAIGNALGQGKSATVGIISAKNKEISAEDNQIMDLIQTDAAINAGNSGGALVNLDGQVIGINTAKLAAEGVEGMGFAIPSNTVKEVIEDIMQDGSVQRPFIGITGLTITEDIKQMYSMPAYGVFIAEVVPNGSAYNAGIVQGDIVTSFNGVTITTIEGLQEEISKTQIGSKISAEVYRNDGSVTLTVEIMDSNSNKTF